MNCRRHIWLSRVLGSVLFCMVLGRIQAGPQGTNGVPAQAAVRPPRVAVMDSPGDGPLARGLADFIEVALQKNGVETYDRRYLRVLLAERGLGRTEVLEADSLRLVPLPSMKIFVRGTAEWVATNRFSLSLGAFLASDGTLVAKATGGGEYPRDWLATVERDANEVARHLLGAQTNSQGMARAKTVLWMPEASSWFFRGMECYRDRDYLQAAMCFCKARQWDEGFSLARLWEVKGYRQAGFAELATALLEAGRVGGLPEIGLADKRIAVVVAGKGITPEQRTAFERGLAASKDVSLLDTGWLGATAQEADLQLTGETVPRSENRNVWLAVDDVVMLEKLGQRVRARRLDVIRATETARADTDELTSEGLQRLAGMVLRGGVAGAADEHPPIAGNPQLAYFPEWSTEAAWQRALKAAQGHPKDAPRLIEAADSIAHSALQMQPAALTEVDYPPEWRMHRALLERAVAQIQSDPGQPDASFLLASALWRMRTLRENHMVTWIHDSPLTPLRQDFRPLLNLFPQSPEATSLAESLSDGFFQRTLPKDQRFVQPLQGKPSSDEENKRRLVEDFKRYLGEKNYYCAWAAQYALSQKGAAISLEAPEEARRFQIECRNLTYKVDNQPIIDQFSKGNLPANAPQLLGSYKPLINGARRAEEITAICQPFIRQTGTPAVIIDFLLQQRGRWLADYGTHEITSTAGGSGLTDPAPILIRRADEAVLELMSAKTASTLERVQKASDVPFRQRLCARYCDGILRYDTGDYYAATEILRGVLADLESMDPNSMDMPPYLLDRALGALRTARLFGDSALDLRLCCGPPIVLPYPPGANTNQLQNLFERFKAGLAGRGDALTPSATLEDLGVASVLALVSRELTAGGISPETLRCIEALGERGAPLAPQLISLIMAGQDAGASHAFVALGNIGPGAAGAVPVVLLSLERTREDRTFLQNVRWSLNRLGSPPRRTMPYLARLLNHPDRFVALNTAKTIQRSGLLPPEVQSRLTSDNLIGELQDWWERTGSSESWKDPKGDSAR